MNALAIMVHWVYFDSNHKKINSIIEFLFKSFNISMLFIFSQLTDSKINAEHLDESKLAAFQLTASNLELAALV